MRSRKIISFILAGSMTLATAVCLLPGQFSDVKASDSIVCDGDNADWGSIASRGSSDGAVSDWKVCVSDSYLYLYVAQNPTGNYGEAVGNTQVGISYTDSQYYNGNYSTIYISQDYSSGDGSYALKDAWGQSISSGQVVFEGGNTDYNVDSAFAEIAIPRSWFPSEEFTLTYAGKSIASSDIPTIDGASALKNQDTETGYGNGSSSEPSTEDITQDTEESTDKSGDNGTDTTETTATNGIVIDGNFSDWNSVQKIQNPASALKEGAAIWIGDYVYLYLREQDDWEGCGTQVGSRNNGNYFLELNDGSKTSIMITKDGAQLNANNETYDLDMSYSNHEYEIAVPVEKLQGYNSTITSLNFGIMGDESMGYITQGMINQSPDIDKEDTTEGKLKKITYDYDFTDWEGYKKTSIGYNTYADSSAALYSDGDVLFGYVDYYAGYYYDAFNYIYLCINGNNRYTYYGDNDCIKFTLRGVDANGNVEWWNQAVNLGPGDYEYYIFDMAYVGSASNINNPDDKYCPTYCYGRAYIHVDKTGRAQMEYYIDIPTLVKVVNITHRDCGAYDWHIKQSDIKTFHVMYPRIGWGQWVTCGGTSTGPVLGIILCFAVVVAAQLYRKKRSGRLA